MKTSEEINNWRSMQLHFFKRFENQIQLELLI